MKFHTQLTLQFYWKALLQTFAGYARPTAESPQKVLEAMVT